MKKNDEEAEKRGYKRKELRKLRCKKNTHVVEILKGQRATPRPPSPKEKTAEGKILNYKNQFFSVKPHRRSDYIEVVFCTKSLSSNDI